MPLMRSKPNEECLGLAPHRRRESPRSASQTEPTKELPMFEFDAERVPPAESTPTVTDAQKLRYAEDLGRLMASRSALSHRMADASAPVRLLIVDDDHNVRLLLKATLSP